MALRSKPQESIEADVTAFIAKGGSVAGQDKPAKPAKDKVFPLRIDPETDQLIDLEMKGRKPRVSKNSWIMEAILEKLESAGRA